MRLLIDTNIVLDVWLDRRPHVYDSAKILAAVESGQITGSLCATTITTLHYLATKSLGSKDAMRLLSDLFRIFSIAPVTKSILMAALEKKSRDFEDSVLVEAARSTGVDGIITRDVRDFSKSGLSIYTPDDVVSLLAL